MRQLLFHVPDKLLLLLAAALLLNLMFRGKLRLVADVAKPLLATARALTPLAVHPWFLTLFAVVWLMALRVVFQMQMGNWGLLPGQGG